MAISLKELEERVQALEADQANVQELIRLLEEVKSALRVFVRIGNAFKWIAVLVASVAGAAVVIRKWL